MNERRKEIVALEIKDCLRSKFPQWHKAEEIWSFIHHENHRSKIRFEEIKKVLPEISARNNDSHKPVVKEGDWYKWNS